MISSLTYYLRYLLAVHSTPKDYIAVHLANFVAFIIVFIAKLPWMHKVRIFGINK